MVLLRDRELAPLACRRGRSRRSEDTVGRVLVRAHAYAPSTQEGHYCTYYPPASSSPPVSRATMMASRVSHLRPPIHQVRKCW